MAFEIDMTRAAPLSQINQADISKMLNGLDPSARELAEVGLPNVLSGTGHADRLLGRANDVYQLGGKKTANLKGQPSLGSQPSTAGPRSNYSHQAAKTAGTYYVPLEQQGSIRTTGKPFSGAYLAKSLNKASPERRARFMKKHGIVQGSDGKYLLPVQQQSAQAGMAALAPGQQNPLGTSTFGLLQRTSWLAPVAGFAGGGLSGLIGGMVMSKALKHSAGAMTSGNALAPGFAGLAGMGTASPGRYLGNIVGAGGYGSMAAGAQMLGLEGMAFNMRKQMTSIAEDFKDQSMISMINDPGMPIEDLIFMFMAHMADKYDKKLRNKMEETALAEKRERQNERARDKGRMLGGIASLVPGVGPLIGSAIQMGVQEKIRVKNALNGGTQSSTMLMQEVQMLMQKWKQLNEMLSNLSKSLHDMAMTPIRNLR